MNPIEQACCTNCRFSSNEIECRPATQCKEASKCPSDSAICPDQVNKPDGTPCKDSDGRESSCSNGKCQNRCDSLSDLDPVRFNYTNRLAVCLCGDDQEEWMCARCCQSGKNKTTWVISSVIIILTLLLLAPTSYREFSMSMLNVWKATERSTIFGLHWLKLIRVESFPSKSLEP